MEKRFIHHFSNGEGVIDYALNTVDLEQQLDRVRKRGLEIVGPIEGYRVQEDGTKLQFQWGLSHANLPFLITDITPRSLRVPAQVACKHANSSQGIKGLVMAVRDLEEASRCYSIMLGLEGEVAGPCRKKFSLGQTDLILASAEDSSDVKKHLDQYGDSPFAIEIRTIDQTYTGEMNLSRTRNTRAWSLLDAIARKRNRKNLQKEGSVKQ